jgi:hypothetical protein
MAVLDTLRWGCRRGSAGRWVARRTTSRFPCRCGYDGRRSRRPAARGLLLRLIGVQRVAARCLATGVEHPGVDPKEARTVSVSSPPVRAPGKRLSFKAYPQARRLPAPSSAIRSRQAPAGSFHRHGSRPRESTRTVHYTRFPASPRDRRAHSRRGDRYGLRFCEIAARRSTPVARHWAATHDGLAAGASSSGERYDRPYYVQPKNALVAEEIVDPTDDADGLGDLPRLGFTRRLIAQRPRYSA